MMQQATFLLPYPFCWSIPAASTSWAIHWATWLVYVAWLVLFCCVSWLAWHDSFYWKRRAEEERKKLPVIDTKVQRLFSHCKRHQPWFFWSEPRPSLVVRPHSSFLVQILVRGIFHTWNSNWKVLKSGPESANSRWGYIISYILNKQHKLS